MPLATNLPTDKIVGGPDHAAGHNTTNTRVNEVAVEVNTLSARPRIITPLSYGAVGNGSTNDQTALAAALADLDPGDTLDTLGLTYAHNSSLTLATSGVTVRGGGEFKATVQTASAFTITGNDVLVEDVTFSLAGRTTRGSTLAHNKVNIDGSTGGGKRVTLRRVTVNDSHASGIFMFGAQDYLIDACTVKNTAADGIHNTYGSQRGVIRSPRVTDVGDDGVAVVSYFGETVCADITCYDAIVTNSAARGMSVIGGTRIRYHDCEVIGSAAAGLIVSCEESFTSHAVTDAVVERIRLSGCNTAAATIAHGAVLVTTERTGFTCDNILIRDISIKDTAAAAPWAVGANTFNSGAMTNLRLEGVRAYGTGPTGFSSNLAAADYKLIDYRQGDASQGWELLGEFKSASAFGTSGAITIPQRDMLQIVIRILNQSGTARPALRFNGDTASNYWNTYTGLGATNTTLSAAGTMGLLSNQTAQSVRTIEVTVANNAVGWQKAAAVRQATASPAGEPEAGHIEWGNTTTPITSVTLLNDGSGVTFNAHSGIMIFGRNFS